MIENETLHTEGSTMAPTRSIRNVNLGLFWNLKLGLASIAGTPGMHT